VDCVGKSRQGILLADGATVMMLSGGERAINPNQAADVERIFSMFATGASPIAIEKALNEKGIPAPSRGAWRDTTIRGHALRGTGLLRNELYIGRLVWNRLTHIRNPATGRRVSRVNPHVQLMSRGSGRSTSSTRSSGIRSRPASRPPRRVRRR
jgi:hypothetical protein